MGFPFPNVSPDVLSISELEHSVCRAYRLGLKWRCRDTRPYAMLTLSSIYSAPISDVRFVPGHQDKWLVTVSKSIWSVLAIWDIRPRFSNVGSGRKVPQRKCGEWSPKGAVIKGFCLNSDPHSEVTLAVACLHDDKETVYVISVKEQENGIVTFTTITSAYTHFKPMTLQGDVLALGDDFNQTAVWNWKTNEYATLQGGHNEGDSWQHNAITQILFAHDSVFVARDRSINLFPYPSLQVTSRNSTPYSPIAQHSFGWIDGITATLVAPNPGPGKAEQSISILSREKNIDPWHSDRHSIEHYALFRSPLYSPPHSPAHIQTNLPYPRSPRYVPYIFPPFRTSHIPSLLGSLRGSLRCTTIALGRHGTAVWISPQDRAAGGLYFSEDHLPLQVVPYAEQLNESLSCAVFWGGMMNDIGDSSGVDWEQSHAGAQRGDEVIEKWTVCMNDKNDWTALDYDEDTGRIALGSGRGDVIILFL
ncbi:hypothetical protein AMATHDRAFT_66098 [Amanita thiersii Skay4041]|uniref:Uncharacterized protein n=1 Tax=Amanita thiersii Skay4041 TaxID=703135 RepID=A0A2A9NC52_9AGAR|nr:hypothetical protein AMATHDRAFT_66098 [Amanita thiersii Skay4041]